MCIADGQGRLQSIHRSCHSRLLSAKCKQMKLCVKAWAPRVSKGPTIEVLLRFRGKSIFYVALVTLKACKLLPLHFTCLCHQAWHLIGRSLRARIYVCASMRADSSTPGVRPTPVANSGVRGWMWSGWSQCDHTAGSPIHRSISPLHPPMY